MEDGTRRGARLRLESVLITRRPEMILPPPFSHTAFHRFPPQPTAPPPKPQLQTPTPTPNPNPPPPNAHPNPDH
ncbi:hypothetical protein K523DRAFT_422439 [Schizophyllum commune Tattone D]|nr:hypothetical protein K523DRAFT_422439 [Schizophyllum commune Tattone D]